MTRPKKIKELLAAIGVNEEAPARNAAFVVGEAVSELEGYLETVREFKSPPFVFDPTDQNVVSFVIATAMFAMPKRPLAELPQVVGSGIYALFYEGPFPTYSRIRGSDVPIYIGSAGPIAPLKKDPPGPGRAIYKRLSEHHKSISQVEQHHKGDASNLRIADFTYRYLVIKPGWELSAENFLIDFFMPVWNKESKVFGGLGKHGDNKDVRANTMSPFDALHPGRPWALGSKQGAEAAEIKAAVEKHLRTYGNVKLDIDALLKILTGEAGGPAGDEDTEI